MYIYRYVCLVVSFKGVHVQGAYVHALVSRGYMSRGVPEVSILDRLVTDIPLVLLLNNSCFTRTMQ